MSQAFKLFRLQQIDSQLDKSQQRLYEIELALKDDSLLRTTRNEVQEAEIEYQAALKQLKNLEQQSSTQRIKIEETENALYSGKIKNPKELQDLQNELMALKRYLTVLEDRQLEAMIELEEKESALHAVRQKYMETSSEFDRRRSELSREKDLLANEITRQESERAAISESIPMDQLELYEQLRLQRGGIAVARIVDRTCSACGSTLSTALFSRAQNPNLITRCSTCNRILYFG